MGSNINLHFIQLFSLGSHHAPRAIRVCTYTAVEREWGSLRLRGIIAVMRDSESVDSSNETDLQGVYSGVQKEV